MIGKNAYNEGNMQVKLAIILLCHPKFVEGFLLLCN